MLRIKNAEARGQTAVEPTDESRVGHSVSILATRYTQQHDAIPVDVWASLSRRAGDPPFIGNDASRWVLPFHGQSEAAHDHGKIFRRVRWRDRHVR